ncbi:MAG: ATP-binding protein [Deltaproteobacteria bacterium]|jgi:DNA helicase HerA-like ATPase|nr:ATP-binding protein [Deltaproteobacteria bacterium]
MSSKDKSGQETSADVRSQANGKVAKQFELLIGSNARAISDPLLKLPSSELRRHTAIFGGSGSGKTMLLRRLVEQAALGGVPSVVIDISGDLTYLGQQWEKEPQGWSPEDRESARRYFETTETVVWTPGITSGNPFNLAALPEFALSDEDEDYNDLLKEWVDWCLESLKQILKFKQDEFEKKGLLAWILRYMVKNKRNGFKEFRKAISNLPLEAYDEFGDKIDKLADKLSSELNGIVQIQPELENPNSMSIYDLFNSKSGKTRISVISLIGLNGLEAQQFFVHKLVTELFSYMLKNRAKGDGVAGLLAIDEAKDFVPSVSAVPSKGPIIRFGNQARKFGYGLVLASQALKSLDAKVVNNCATQFFGRLGSDNDNELCKKIIGVTTGSLRSYHFFVNSQVLKEQGNRRAELIFPMSLSCHPNPAPDIDLIKALAAKSRNY